MGDEIVEEGVRRKGDLESSEYAYRRARAKQQITILARSGKDSSSKMASVREELLQMRTNVGREESTCALCAEVFTDPRLLPCLHSFCKRCLEHSTNPHATLITCHVCRKEFQLPPAGVTEFPSNFIINNMLDIAAVKNSEMRPILCTSCCEKLPATSRCVDCMDYLCYACHNAHGRVRLTKDHQILSLDQLKRSDEACKLLHRPITCKEHPSEKIRYYCRTCETAICRECTISQHSSNTHDYTPLHNAIEAQRDDIIKLHQSVQQRVPVIRRSTRSLDDTILKLEARADSLRNEIQEKTPRIIRSIQERERSLIADLDNIVQTKKRILKKQLETMDQEFKKLHTSTTFAEMVLSHGSDAEILSIKRQLTDNLKELARIHIQLEPEENDQIICDTAADNVMRAIQTYGRFNTNNSGSSEVLNCVLLDEVKQIARGQTVQMNLVVRNQYEVIDRKSVSSSIMAELRTPDSGIIIPEVRENGEGYFLLTFRAYSNGQHQLSIKFNGRPINGSPFQLNVIGSNPNIPNNSFSSNQSTHDMKSNRAVPPIKDNLELPPPIHRPSYSQPHHDNNNIIENKQKQSQQQQQQHLPEKAWHDHPTHASAYSNGDNDLSSRCINAFGSRGSEFGQFNGAFGVAYDNQNSRIIATDCNNHRVQVFDDEGNFMFVIGERGSGEGQFQCPTGVAVTNSNEIVVCERLKGRIQVFDQNGRFRRRFLLNELKASTLTIDIAGRIIIADYTNCCIYVLDPILERWSKFGGFGTSEGEMQYPCYVATNTQGHIYVSDMHHNKIKIYDADGIFLQEIGNQGDRDGQLMRPTGIAVDSRGRLYVADRDNHRIQIFDKHGGFLAKYGAKGERLGELNDPHGLAIISDGKVAEADFRNNRVQIFSIFN